MKKEKSAFTPIKNRRTFEEVSNQIKKRIFEGVYTAGDKLPPEAELAAQFGVGRQSVREALRILELSGFLTIQKGGGGGAIIQDTISSTISNLFLDAFQMEKTSLEELTLARVEIEKVVLKHAVQNADENDILSLRENLFQAKQKIAKNQLIIAENIQFHQILAQASKNNLFVIVVNAITTAVRHCMSQMGPPSNQMSQQEWASERTMQSKNTLAYHEEMITAIEQRDVQKATEILEEHLLEVKNRLRQIMKSQSN
jgi:DNA-binding FadR family transcriptional regulator